MVAVVPPGTLSAQSLADAVGRALAGPSLRSFPPCDVDGGPSDGGAIASPVGHMSTWADFDEAARWAQAGRTRRAVVARRRRGRCRPRARAAAGDPSRHRRAAGARRRAGEGDAGAGRSSGRRAGRRSASSTAMPTSIMPRRATRRSSSAPSGRRCWCWASWAPAAWRSNACSARGRCRCWCRRGIASRRSWCRPCRRSASRSFDLRRARRVQPVRGLLQVNTHVDLIDWKGGRGFVGEAAALGALLRALACAHRRRRARGRSQSPSCDGRRGVGFPKVDVAKSTEMPGLASGRRMILFASREGGARLSSADLRYPRQTLWAD